MLKLSFRASYAHAYKRARNFLRPEKIFKYILVFPLMNIVNNAHKILKRLKLAQTNRLSGLRLIKFVQFGLLMQFRNWVVIYNVRKKPPEVFCEKKVSLKISQISQENTSVGFSFYESCRPEGAVFKSIYFEEHLRTIASLRMLNNCITFCIEPPKEPKLIFVHW